MAKARTIKSTLVKIFEQSGSVVYFVAESQKITFANQACADWLDANLEELVGTKAVYATDHLDDLLEEKAKGLALAPELFDDSVSVEKGLPTTVQISALKEGKLCWRQATINRLYDKEGAKLLGLLVVASDSDTAELSSELTSSEPFDSIALHQAIVRIRNTDRLRYQLKNLIGNSAAMKRVVRQSRTAAKSDCAFVVVGPPGSGREHLAKSIYNERESVESDQDHSSLIPIHCAITDPLQIQQTMKELIDEREKRSAASDAQSQIEVTVLLIDVDRLSEGSQLELLGFLDLPGFTFHAIATAETNLLNPGSANDDAPSFNHELAARLSTMVIELPPLKRRRSDLPLLAQVILEQGNASRDKQLSKFSNQAMEWLCEYDWPRNFDQFVSTINAAAESATGNQIEANDLPDQFRQSLDAQRVGEAKETKINLDEYLAGIEVELIKRALAYAKGNKTRASLMLSVSRPKLLRRLQQFGLMSSSNDEELLDASVFQEADEKEDGE